MMLIAADEVADPERSKSRSGERKMSGGQQDAQFFFFDKSKTRS
jgi:hypothetical protein